MNRKAMGTYASLAVILLTIAILSLLVFSISQQQRGDLILVSILVLAVLWVIAAVLAIYFSRTRGTIDGTSGEWEIATFISPPIAALLQRIGKRQRK